MPYNSRFRETKFDFSRLFQKRGQSVVTRTPRLSFLDGLPGPNPARLLRNYQALTNPQPVRYLLPLA
jgi:hypothetical protein